MHTLIQYGPWAIGVAMAAATWVWHHDRQQLTAWYDAHTTAQQRASIASDLAVVRPLAEEGVLLTEQQFGHLPGPQKFVQATDHVLTILADRGITVPPSLIHGAVQKAYSQAKVDGTLAASSPKAIAATAPDSKAAS